MKKLSIVLSVVLGLMMFAGVALAQTYTPLAPLPIGEGGATPTTYTLTTYLSGAIKLLVAVAGALAVLMLIIAGTKYVAAGINPSAKSDARGDINNALIGLTLVLTAYLLLRSIDPRLVEFNLALPPVGAVPTSPSATTATPQQPSTQRSAPRLQSGGRSSPVQPSAPAPIQPSASLQTPPPTPPAVPLVDATAIWQNIINARINRANDYSIISNCIGNTSYDLCPRTDLNGDGQTNVTDISLFGQRGRSFDANQNNILELGDAPVAVSCFFKTSTANVQAMLPLEVPSDSGFTASCGGGGGRIIPPTVSCNGATWLKESVLASRCAVTNGLNTMPFGFVYGGGSQFSQFKTWVTGASAGSAVNLSDLFVKTFFRQVSYGDGVQNEYAETDLGSLTYTTIAAYDLNNDGIADFSAGGADVAAFNACRGSSVSGACAQADFNEDRVIDSRDLALVTFMQTYVFGGTDFIPLGWYLNWFESMFFDPTGYTDKQIISYCLYRTAFEKCGIADVDGNLQIDNADLAAFNAGAPLLDFNSDGKVNLR